MSVQLSALELKLYAVSVVFERIEGISVSVKAGVQLSAKRDTEMLYSMPNNVVILIVNVFAGLMLELIKAARFDQF